MKDIYDMLNNVDINIDDLNKIELSKKEKNKIYQSVIKKKSRSWYRHAGQFITAAAAVILIGIVIFNKDVNAMAMDTVANIVDFFQGNTKSDYVEKVDSVVVADGFTMDLVKVEREDAEIRVNYKLTFDDDISMFKTMGENLGYKIRSVYYTDAFRGCKFYINGEDIEYLCNHANADAAIFFYYEVNDISITEHELNQELVICLNDKNYNQDMDIKLDFSNINLGNKILAGPCTVDYKLEAGKYSAEIKKDTLDIKTVSLNGTGFNITGYAYTNTGLKIYTDFIPGPEGADSFPIVYFKAKDNLGNQYLYYPIYDINDQSKMTFYIYDGPADFNNEYNDYLAEGATSMSLILYEEVYNFDTNERSENQLCEEFTVDLVLTE